MAKSLMKILLIFLFSVFHLKLPMQYIPSLYTLVITNKKTFIAIFIGNY